MAKLLSYYRLCPLIDAKNLLGITETPEPGVIIVTLGRNIAIKYRLFDQKQLCSWRTKEKFSSPVWYDTNLAKYVAVFNQTVVRIWSDEEELLDNVKKYKFKQNIQTVFVHNGSSFVVFKCGSIYPLKDILDVRKTFEAIEVVNENFEFQHVSLNGQLYFLILTESFMVHWSVYSEYSKNDFVTFKIKPNCLGFELFVENGRVKLLTFYNSGKVYSKPLIWGDNKSIEELFAVVDNISTQHSIKILTIDENYLAFYGSEPNDEGASLFIYNTQFKVIQSKQIHKLYNEEAKMWKTFNFIILPVGLNLMVVPFCLESEKLISLIGSHKTIDSDVSLVTKLEIAHWDKPEIHHQTNKEFKAKHKLSSTINKKLKTFYQDGVPEAAIVEDILPEILETNSTVLVAESLKIFTDIPESFLAKLLNFALFNCCEPHLMNEILSKPFSEVIILPHLRNLFSIDKICKLLQYLLLQLTEDGTDLPNFTSAQSEQQIIKWMALVLDANYQKFILSKEKNIENILIDCKQTVEEYVEAVESVKSLVPVLIKLKSEAEGKCIVNSKSLNSLYSIESVSY